MKKLFLLFFIFHFSFDRLSFSGGGTLCAQTWLWGKEGVGAIKAGENDAVVAADRLGNAYLTGSYDASIIFNPFTLNDISPYEAMYLIKFDSNGNVLWAKQPLPINGSPQTEGVSIAIDTSNNIIMGGILAGFGQVVFGPDTIAPSSLFGFLAKYDPNGNALWVKALNGRAYSVAVDKNNNIYVGSTVGFIKYDINGNMKWFDTISIPEYLYAISTDYNGYIYITGYFQGTFICGPDTLYTSSTNGCVFVAKYNSNGTCLWARQAKTTSGSYGRGLSIINDNSGAVYVAGYFSNATTSDTISFGTYKLTNDAPSALFVAKYDTDGNIKWAEQSLGKEQWKGSGLTTDKYDNIYVAGSGIGDSLQFGGKIITAQNSTASFILHFDTAGKVQCGSILANGGAAPILQGWNTCVAADPIGKYVYLAGTYDGGPIICGPDTLVDKNGGMLPYIARWQSCCSGASYTIIGNTSIKPGDSTVLTVIPAGTNYLWSNGATTSSITVAPGTNTKYGVFVYDSLGCSGDTYVEVNIECGSLFIPDAFSPNGDGKNDVFYVRGPCISGLDFVIFDRWGNKVFETQNINEGWDGKYAGKAMNTGTYVYDLHATLQDGTILQKHGNITLVR